MYFTLVSQVVSPQPAYFACQQRAKHRALIVSYSHINNKKTLDIKILFPTQ